MTNGSRILINIGRIAAGANALLSAATDIGAYLGQLQERRRQRQALAKLDQRLLNDIGLSSAASQAETRQPFWR